MLDAGFLGAENLLPLTRSHVVDEILGHHEAIAREINGGLNELRPREDTIVVVEVLQAAEFTRNTTDGRRCQ